jgi:hypothetical protein
MFLCYDINKRYETYCKISPHPISGHNVPTAGTGEIEILKIFNHKVIIHKFRVNFKISRFVFNLTKYNIVQKEEGII